LRVPSKFRKTYWPKKPRRRLGMFASSPLSIRVVQGFEKLL
jgi:hypothetical protein